MQNFSYQLKAGLVSEEKLDRWVEIYLSKLSLFSISPIVNDKGEEITTATTHARAIPKDLLDAGKWLCVELEPNDAIDSTAYCNFSHRVREALKLKLSTEDGVDAFLEKSAFDEFNKIADVRSVYNKYCVYKQKRITGSGPHTAKQIALDKTLEEDLRKTSRNMIGRMKVMQRTMLYDEWLKTPDGKFFEGIRLLTEKESATWTPEEKTLVDEIKSSTNITDKNDPQHPKFSDSFPFYGLIHERSLPRCNDETSPIDCWFNGHVGEHPDEPETRKNVFVLDTDVGKELPLFNEETAFIFGTESPSEETFSLPNTMYFWKNDRKICWAYKSSDGTRFENEDGPDTLEIEEAIQALQQSKLAYTTISETFQTTTPQLVDLDKKTKFTVAQKKLQREPEENELLIWKEGNEEKWQYRGSNQTIPLNGTLTSGQELIPTIHEYNKKNNAYSAVGSYLCLHSSLFTAKEEATYKIAYACDKTLYNYLYKQNLADTLNVQATVFEEKIKGIKERNKSSDQEAITKGEQLVTSWRTTATTLLESDESFDLEQTNKIKNDIQEEIKTAKAGDLGHHRQFGPALRIAADAILSVTVVGMLVVGLIRLARGTSFFCSGYVEDWKIKPTSTSSIKQLKTIEGAIDKIDGALEQELSNSDSQRSVRRM